MAPRWVRGTLRRRRTPWKSIRDIELQRASREAKAFYSKLFDWKLEDMSMPGGALHDDQRRTGTGGRHDGQSGAGVAAHWMAYVGVDDVRAPTRKARIWAPRSPWT